MPCYVGEKDSSAIKSLFEYGIRPPKCYYYRCTFIKSQTFYTLTSIFAISIGTHAPFSDRCENKVVQKSYVCGCVMLYVCVLPHRLAVEHVSLKN